MSALKGFLFISLPPLLMGNCGFLITSLSWKLNDFYSRYPVARKPKLPPKHSDLGRFVISLVSLYDCFHIYIMKTDMYRNMHVFFLALWSYIRPNVPRFRSARVWIQKFTYTSRKLLKLAEGKAKHLFQVIQFKGQLSPMLTKCM